MSPPDDFAAEHPDTIAMPAQSLVGKLLAQQLMQEGFEEFDNILPDDDIALFAPPGARPFRQVRAEPAEGCHFVRVNRDTIKSAGLPLSLLNAPGTLNILDRFHAVAKMNLAIDEVRAGEARRMAQDGYEPVLRKSRWCLLKRPREPDRQAAHQAARLVALQPEKRPGLSAERKFQQLWEYCSPTWAGKFLDQWCAQVMRSRIEPMKKFARTVRKHRELLLNYFRAKKGVLQRRGRGLEHHEKSLRFQNIHDYRNLALSCTWKITRA